jgi:hypothetical protein
MQERKRTVRAAGAIVLVAALAAGTAPAADKEKEKDKKGGVVAGIVIRKDDKSITLKGDGDEEPVKYTIPEGADKKLTEKLKTIFTVGRARLAYKMNGETRELVDIEKQPGARSGTVTGVVVQKYENNFWVEVKPKNGVAEGFAAHFQGKNTKEVTDKIKDLEIDDIVTIRYTTDNERHRIESIQKVGRAKK